ncbi:endonuclease V-domain-containing protein [Polychytrium aggregatum]|uniref:endonuclease V-domain-containing protein n=1 Tax=Polychytrium aggregatum TaxID=110093 RepID=UPI0022FE3CD0|nr:endonuclease V-domain-containing protein [Polychytrium aggregatum]KAI9193754.1 endonuclease V-domain-containing protein [Polychytrium aggregatum]
MAQTASTSSSITDAAVRQQWIEVQARLASSRTATDDIAFSVPPQADGPWQGLRLIGGVDVSFVENTDEGVGCLAILEFPSFKVLYTDMVRVTLSLPYIPGFLAFREASVFQTLLDNLKQRAPELYPQVLFVDGNGILHPRKFGSACHLGVLEDIPTIGVGKNFLQISHENLRMQEVKARRNELKQAGDYFDIIGSSGFIYGAALRASNDSINAIYVSPGHRVSHETAIKLTIRCCKFRVPEPIRAADGLSRAYIRAHPSG